ncbi:hypothetical protein [Catenuloplanes atrovinosus]|uniref:Uncharacterized protein n=1 Tax=Catenuloplanes atrovinosus TaxID=137266 RepID=A0AAE3YNY8_9ACTN|nr:hypothetical protein [Catenuloplanes atrovinosus]MDR7277328.1 hypothetical protein [Catenuloplanes atrovinosus]
MITSHEARAAAVSRRIVAAELSAGEQYAMFAGLIRDAFGRLRTGLGQAHARCAAVDEQTWATYAADLDRGLDELHMEIARSAEHADERDLAQILRVHVTELELAGWRLQVSLPTAPQRLATE